MISTSRRLSSRPRHHAMAEMAHEGPWLSLSRMRRLALSAATRQRHERIEIARTQICG
jgi:hypothetical protein